MHLLWGKWGGYDDSPFPLLGHLLDTAAVALALWPQLSPPVRANATALFAPADLQLAAGRFAVLAAAHDIGKATREFSCQRWSRDSAAFAAHADALQRSGLPTEAPDRPQLAAGDTGWLRHEALSGLILTDQYQLPLWAARAVAGHHGRYQRPQHQVGRDLADLRTRTTDASWAAAQRRLLDAVVDAVSGQTGADCQLSGWPARAPRQLVPFVLALTGLICVCDWTASDDSFIRRAPRELLTVAEPARYLQARLGQAHQALDGVLLGSHTPHGDFPALFAGRRPRGAAQQWATQRQHGPGLTIVMAPMGEGKTELALYTHATATWESTGTASGDGDVADAAHGAHAGDGLFFGLPTTATADAMFARVQQFWQGTRATGRLAHGQAVLHDFYQPTALHPTGICDGEHPGHADGLRPADWFAGRHRGLLAPVTVGTCDQVLAAALAHKFLPVRLAALGGKHVVLDEVHTYDPYQHELLCRLLGWLGAYRCRVTLLSATLPRARVAQLTAAWTAGWHRASRPAVRDAVRDELPAVLTYPSVLTVADQLELTALTAWRTFTLRIRTHPVPPDRAGSAEATAELVRRLRAEQPGARIGLLVNTVDRAIALYQALTEQPGRPAGEDACDGVRSALLHSRMTAAQRRQATQTLHELVGPQAPAGPVLIVATQVAEASLDLDLDVLVTDLAPMASLLQRTGRLWRHSVNTGSGWTHPPHLGYRTGDPTVYVLVPTGPDGDLVAGAAALPYTGAELRRTLTDPACLAGGHRTELRIPQDVQPAVDGAHVSLADLTAAAADEPAETQEVLQHLAAQLTKATAARRTGTSIDRLPDWALDDDDPWAGPDWSALTSPTLWDDRDGAVTRLQERDQATVLLCDPTGQDRWAWHGTPQQLLSGLDRPALLAAMGATVPVSGPLARDLRAAAAPHQPDSWTELAPALLRGLIPLPLQALPAGVRLDADLGLTRQEIR